MAHYEKNTYSLPEAAEIIEPSIDDLLYLAENESIHLQIFATNCLVLWAGENRYERVTQPYILRPHHAQALRTNKEKKVSKVARLKEGELELGSLFEYREDGNHQPKSLVIRPDNISILGEDMTRLELAEIPIWKDLKQRRENRRKKVEDPMSGIALESAKIMAEAIVRLLNRHLPPNNKPYKMNTQLGWGPYKYLRVIKECAIELAKLNPEEFGNKGKVFQGYLKSNKETGKLEGKGIVGHLHDTIAQHLQEKSLQKYLKTALSLE